MKPKRKKHTKPTTDDELKGELFIADYDVKQAQRRLADASVEFAAACSALSGAVLRKIKLASET